MSRKMKLMSVAAMLSICLLLTGCYVSPDDDTNVEEQREVRNTLVITTNTPTPGITPDVVSVTPVATPVSGNNNNQPVPTNGTAPDTTGSGSWTDWGSDGAPTSIPVGEKINLGPGATALPDGTTPTAETTTPPSPTPVPTTAIVTPTPTPPSLQLGFKGSESVRELQRRLKELGYYKGSIDGDFGENTEKKR